MKKKISNKAVKKITTAFLVTSIITGSFASTTIAITDEGIVNQGTNTDEMGEIDDTIITDEKISDALDQFPDLEKLIIYPIEEASSKQKDELDITKDSAKETKETGIDLDEVEGEFWSLSETTMTFYYDSNEQSLASLVEEIPENIWEGLTSLNIEIQSELTTVDNEWLSLINRSTIKINELNLNFTSDSSFTVGDNLTIPWCSSVTSNAKFFGNNAFQNSTNLVELNLPNAEIFGNNAFSNTANLAELVLPNVQTFGNNTLFMNSSLNKIILPKLKTLGSSFGALSKLVEVELPMLTTVEKSTFGAMIRKLSIPKVTTIEEGSLAWSQTIQIPGGSQVSGVLAELEIGIPDTELGNIGIYNREYINKLTLTNTDKLVNISDQIGIKNFPRLKDFTSYSESVDDNVLSSLEQLETVEMPNAKNFGDNTFNGASSLVNVSLPQAQNFGDNAFNGTKSLAHISLPQAQNFGDNAFNGAKSLAHVSLPQAQIFGDNAFRLVEKLPELSLPLAEIFGDNAFSATGIGIIDLPSVEFLPTNSFENSIIGFVKVKNSSTLNYESVFLNKGNLIGIIYGDGPRNHSFEHAENLVISDSDRLYNTENLDDASWGVHWEKEGETVGTEEKLAIDRAQVSHSGDYISKIWTKNVPTIASILNTDLGIHTVTVQSEPVITAITAEAKPQTVWLGSDLTELKLWDFVSNIQDQDNNEIRQDQLNIEIIRLPNTNLLTERNPPQHAVIELSSKETSAKVQISVPIEVIYGQTLMYGGIGVSGFAGTPHRTGFAVTIHQKNNELFLKSSLGNGEAPTQSIHSQFSGFYLGLSAYRPVEDRTDIQNTEIKYYQYVLNGTDKVNKGVTEFGVEQKLDVQNGDIIQMTSAESGNKNGQFISTTDTWISSKSAKANYEVVNQSFRRLNLDLFKSADIHQINLWENTTLDEANQHLKTVGINSDFDNIELIGFESLPDTTTAEIEKNATIRIEETLISGKKVYDTIIKPINIVSPVSITTSVNNNESIEIGDEFEIKHTIENSNQSFTIEDLKIDGSIFYGQEADFIMGSLELVHVDKSVESIINSESDEKFKLNYSSLPNGGVIEVRYRMKAMEIVNQEEAQEISIQHDTQRVQLSSRLDINDGRLTFFHVPEALEFKDTRLAPAMFNYVVERKYSDWGMSIRDTRSTKTDGTELHQQDWYVTARAETFFEAQDGGFTIPATNIFVGFKTADGNNLDISNNAAQITEKKVISDSEYGERVTDLVWEQEQGFNVTVLDSHTVVPGKKYKNKLDFNLVIGP